MSFHIFHRANSCKGSALLVEAAIFYPIVIFSAMAVMALLLNIYSQTATQAHLHVRLRAEAAEVGDRTQVRLSDAYERDRYRKEAESVSFAVTEAGGPLWKWLEATRAKTYFGGRFTNPAGYETEYYARSYIVNESLTARGLDIAKGIIR